MTMKHVWNIIYIWLFKVQFSGNSSGYGLKVGCYNGWLQLDTPCNVCYKTSETGDEKLEFSIQ